MRQFLRMILILPLMMVTSCSTASFNYRRVDTVFIDGVAYHSEIYSTSYFETGFSPDLGSRRMNVTKYENKNRDIYQLDLPNDGGVWVWDGGIPALESVIKIGGVYWMTPEPFSIIRVDNTAHPTRIHYVSTRCKDDPQLKECVDETVFTAIEGGHRNKQPMAPMQFDYFQNDDQDLMIFGKAPYFVCPKEIWKHNKNLVAAIKDEGESKIIIQDAELNWARETDRIAPCNVKNADGYLGRGADGIWRPLEDGKRDFYYLGVGNKGKKKTVSLGAADKLNEIFFKKVLIDSENVKFEMSPDGHVNLYYNPTNGNVYIFGLNEYEKIKYVAR